MTQLLLFTGKGGVGKSTSSAATALYYANLGHKTLLVSSDPAHSTDDTVGTKIGDTPREISPNLWAMNINASVVTQSRQQEMQTAFIKTFGKFIPSLSDDDSGMSKVFSINNAIPGIDEWGAAEVMSQQFISGEYDLVIFDTAPTGHTLKALAAPAHVKQFILQLRRLKSKVLGKLMLFKNRNEIDELELALGKFCEEIDDLRANLSDSKKSKVILVSIPTEAGFMEFFRTVKYLQSLNLQPHTLVLNHLIPDMGSEVWDTAATNPAATMIYHEYLNQQPWIARYQKLCADNNITLVGSVRLPYEPKGVKSTDHLKDFADLICGPEKVCPPEV